MLLGWQFGNIVADGTPTLNENSAVTFTNLFTGAGDLANNPSRVVSAGLWIRSLGTVAADAGIIQAFASPIDYQSTNWDVFRDSPNQKIYSKGEAAVIRYYPYDETELLFGIAGDTNRPRFNHNLGFLIKGAPNT